VVVRYADEAASYKYTIAIAPAGNTWVRAEAHRRGTCRQETKIYQQMTTDHDVDFGLGDL